MSGVSLVEPWTFAGMSRQPAPPASRLIEESRPDAGVTMQPPDSRKLHCARKNALSPPSKPRKVVRNLTPGKADGVSSTNSRMLFSMRSSLACWSSSDSSAMDARSASASCAYSSASAAHDSASWQSGGGAGAFGATCGLRRCVQAGSARGVGVPGGASAAFRACATFRSCVLGVVQGGCSFGSSNIGMTFSTQRSTFVGANALTATAEPAVMRAASLIVD